MFDVGSDTLSYFTHTDDTLTSTNCCTSIRRLVLGRQLLFSATLYTLRNTYTRAHLHTQTQIFHNAMCRTKTKCGTLRNNHVRCAELLRMHSGGFIRKIAYAIRVTGNHSSLGGKLDVLPCMHELEFYAMNVRHKFTSRKTR